MTALISLRPLLLAALAAPAAGIAAAADKVPKAMKPKLLREGRTLVDERVEVKEKPADGAKPGLMVSLYGGKGAADEIEVMAAQ